MKFFTATAAIALVGTAAAVPTPANSVPTQFRLVIGASSNDKSLVGKHISSCHAGAAINAACVDVAGDAPGATFRLNVTSSGNPEVENWGKSGHLTTTLDITPPIPQSLDITMGLISNLGTGMLNPGYGDDKDLQVSFKDGTNEMGLILRDPKTQKAGAYREWFICNTYTNGYQLTTLNWKTGAVEADDKTCSAVSIRKEPL